MKTNFLKLYRETTLEVYWDISEWHCIIVIFTNDFIKYFQTNAVCVSITQKQNKNNQNQISHKGRLSVCAAWDFLVELNQEKEENGKNTVKNNYMKKLFR